MAANLRGAQRTAAETERAAAERLADWQQSSLLRAMRHAFALAIGPMEQMAEAIACIRRAAQCVRTAGRAAAAFRLMAARRAYSG